MHPVHIFHHSLRRGGGMERYAVVLARGLRERGYEVFFHAQRADEALAAELGVKLNLLPFHRFPRKLRSFRFFRQIDRVRSRVQGLQIALSRVRVRDLAICGGTHRGYLRRRRQLTSPFDLLEIWMEAECYRTARKVISHSRLCGEELRELYALPAQKATVIYPPVDSVFSPAAGHNARLESRRRLSLPADRVVFLFPSTGHGRKGLREIRQAFAGMSDPPLLAIAGPALRAAPAFVRCLGYVQDMAEAYRAADFTILGSSYEPFGLVGVESIRCGTPLLFAEGIGCLEVIKPEAVLTFPVGDVDAIRRVTGRAIEWARAGRTLPGDPESVLLYDPATATHIQALLRDAGAS